MASKHRLTAAVHVLPGYLNLKVVIFVTGGRHGEITPANSSATTGSALKRQGKSDAWLGRPAPQSPYLNGGDWSIAAEFTEEIRQKPIARRWTRRWPRRGCTARPSSSAKSTVTRTSRSCPGCSRLALTSGLPICRRSKARQRRFMRFSRWSRCRARGRNDRRRTKAALPPPRSAASKLGRQAWRRSRLAKMRARSTAILQARADVVPDIAPTIKAYRRPALRHCGPSQRD